MRILPSLLLPGLEIYPARIIIRRKEIHDDVVIALKAGKTARVQGDTSARAGVNQKVVEGMIAGATTFDVERPSTRRRL